MKYSKRMLAALLLLLMVLALCACGAKSGAQGSAAAEPEENPDFLMGAWFAKTATKDGTTVDAEEVFGGTFMLYFSEDGQCTMSIDQDRALVDWELTENGVTLTGDNVYEATFEDAGRTTMTIGINGFDIFMEKYEE